MADGAAQAQVLAAAFTPCTFEVSITAVVGAVVFGTDGVEGDDDPLPETDDGADSGDDVVFMDEETLYAARDPEGIRPLVLGSL